MRILAIDHTERSGVVPDWNEERWRQYIKEEYEKAKFSVSLAEVRISVAGCLRDNKGLVIKDLETSEGMEKARATLRQLSYQSII